MRAGIEAYLPDGYRAPYGLELGQATADPANAEPSAWSIPHLDDDGRSTSSIIRLHGESDGTALALCHRLLENGSSVPVRHPFRQDVGMPAPLHEWVDAVALTHGAGLRARSQGRWVGDQLDATLLRVEHGVVAYRDDEVAARDLVELREWLARTLAHTQVRVEVHAIGELPYVSGESPLLRALSDGKVTGWLPIPVSTDHAPDSWLAAEIPMPSGRIARARPSVALRMSGASREWLVANSALSWSELVAIPGAVVIDERTDAAWAAIHIVETDVSLIVPVGFAHVSVVTDDDGALVTITVANAARCEAEHRRRAEFERDWGRWLDDTSPLDDTELNAGATRAASLFEGSIT